MTKLQQPPLYGTVAMRRLRVAQCALRRVNPRGTLCVVAVAGLVERGPGKSISTAKALTEKSRLLIGWSSARVVALEALHMRCYRCVGLRHTRPQCPASADRGNCFRKLAAREEATPRCAVCAETGRPYGHRMGGHSCKLAMTKEKTAGARATPVAASQVAEVVPLAADGEEFVMAE